MRERKYTGPNQAVSWQYNAVICDTSTQAVHVRCFLCWSFSVHKPHFPPEYCFSFYLNCARKKRSWNVLANVFAPAYSWADEIEHVLSGKPVIARTSSSSWLSAISNILQAFSIRTKCVANVVLSVCSLQRIGNKSYSILEVQWATSFVFHALRTELWEKHVRRWKDASSDCWWNVIRRTVSKSWSWLKAVVRLSPNIRDEHVMGHRLWPRSWCSADPSAPAVDTLKSTVRCIPQDGMVWVSLAVPSLRAPLLTFLNAMLNLGWLGGQRKHLQIMGSGLVCQCWCSEPLAPELNFSYLI